MDQKVKQAYKQGDLKEIRRTIHSNPELSGKEKETSEFIRKHLESLNYESITDVGGTGLLVKFKGKSAGKSVLLRGDIDALPIEETNSFDYRSKNEGVSHKCGHDGHATIMLGVAEKLSRSPLKSGTVSILFQPSEENGKGAQMVLADQNWKDRQFDYAFALHNLPGFKMHEIVTKTGPFTASAESLIIKIKGKTSHAAEPEMGRNPAYLIARILSKSEELTLSNPKEDDFFLITPIYGNFGEKAYGTSAGKGEIHLTIRSWTSKVMEEKRSALINFIDQFAEQKGFKVRYKTLESFATNRNAEEAVEIIRNAAKALNIDQTEIEQPFKWGEDFGFFTQKYTGAMFGLGSGEETPALHNPDFDFPDELIETGVNMFYEIAKSATEK